MKVIKSIILKPLIAGSKLIIKSMFWNSNKLSIRVRGYKIVAHIISKNFICSNLFLHLCDGICYFLISHQALLTVNVQDRSLAHCVYVWFFYKYVLVWVISAAIWSKAVNRALAFFNFEWTLDSHPVLVQKEPFELMKMPLIILILEVVTRICQLFWLVLVFQVMDQTGSSSKFFRFIAYLTRELSICVHKCILGLAFLSPIILMKQKSTLVFEFKITVFTLLWSLTGAPDLRNFSHAYS